MNQRTPKPRPNDPLAPWSRILKRLDGIHAASQGRTFRPSKPECPNPPPRARPPPCRSDPLAILPLELVSEIVRYVEPADVVVLQRVSKQWRVVLASEYIYTLALKAHFPREEETKKTWELHGGGEEMFPECAVEGYREAAKRCLAEKKAKNEMKELEEREEKFEKEKSPAVVSFGEAVSRAERKEEGIEKALKNVSFVEEDDDDDATVIDEYELPPAVSFGSARADEEEDAPSILRELSPVDLETNHLRASQESVLNRSPKVALEEFDEKDVLKEPLFGTPPRSSVQ